MPHEPEPWQTNAARPFVVIEKPRDTVSPGVGLRARASCPGLSSRRANRTCLRDSRHQLCGLLGMRCVTRDATVRKEVVMSTSTLSSDHPIPTSRLASSWLHARELWGGLAIISMWLAVLFVGVFGGNVVKSSAGGEKFIMARGCRGCAPRADRHDRCRAPSVRCHSRKR